LTFARPRPQIDAIAQVCEKGDRMKIARVLVLRFLMVAGAAGCHVYVDEPAKDPQTAAVTPPPAPAIKPAPAPAAPVKVVPLKLHSAAPSGGVTPPPAPAAACFDTGAATAGDCAALQAPSGCAPVPTPLQKCSAYKAYFQPKVAAAAVSCMTGLSGTQACDATQTSSCAKTALARACPDPSVAQLCQIAAGPCKTTATDCAATISGLNDQGKQMVAQCVATGCTAGLSACIDGLSTSAVSAKH
jgi:hypothetical protein